MTSGRPATAVAFALAGAGVFLAVDAWLAGSLFRYVLAGLVAGAALCVPLLTLCVFGARARQFWRRAVFALVPLILLLVLAEVGMRLFGPPPEPPARLAADARLGHVIAPHTGGTDGQGFRNAATPSRCDVLFVGDSQTWGFGVDLDEAFPQRFAALTGAVCYQMADGSYGPVQYRELLRRGLALSPRRVVVAFYFGNDVVDAFDYAGLDGADDVRTPGRTYRVRHNPEFDGPSAPNCTMAAIDALLATSRLLDAAANVLKSRLRGGVLDDQIGAVPFADPAAPTILLPDYRLPALDPSLAFVQDGLAVTGRCIDAIAALCRTAGADVTLLAIPTKEYCYALWRGDELPALAALRTAEAAARAAVFAAAERAGLRVLDLAEPLVASMRSGGRPWRRTGDGHLDRDGHELAARALARLWSH